MVANVCSSGQAYCLLQSANSRCNLHLNGLLGARTDVGHEGETIAEYPWPTDYANNIAGPSTRENHVLITSGYNLNQVARLRITLRGAEKVWEQGHVSLICRPVIHGDKIYWS